MHRNWHEDDIGQLTPEDIRRYCAAAPDYINEHDECGYTPLIAACLKANTDVARVLIDAGADPNVVASDGETPLKAAIPSRGQQFNRVLFDLLIGAGANLNVGFEPPLHVAVARGHRDLVAYLVEKGADPNLKDGDGSPPLFWAGAYGGPVDIEMMRLLIEMGADITHRDGVSEALEARIGANAMRNVMRRDEKS